MFGRAFVLISNFPEKCLTHFTKTSLAIIKLTRAWCNIVEIFRLTAIMQLR